MGREVKVVDLKFDWFEKTKGGEEGNWAETWFGFILDTIECKACDGTGKNKKGKDCVVCYGEGKAQPRIEPPKSWDDDKNGYQMWQDVSEGSPISPVFKKAEDLAKWMVENDSSISGGTSYEGWLGMIEQEGSAPSMIGSIGGGMKSGTSIYEQDDAILGDSE